MRTDDRLNPPEASGPRIEVTRLNPSLLFFFAGRELADPSSPGGWVADSAMKLGIGTYALHRGDEALVYDTFTSPAQALWVRRYLERLGVKRFTVVLSHWHLDHVAGNAVYRDAPILASALTRARLLEHRGPIEQGTLWGPPPITPLVPPSLTFEAPVRVYVGDLEVRLHPVNIHSQDSVILHVPEEKLALVGDTLEDPLTFMVEVEGLVEHLAGLRRLRELDVARLYPNHGDPRVIARGGYDTSLIEATVDYLEKMLTRAHDADFLSGTMEDYLGESLARGWVHAYEPYRAVHAMNLQRVHAYYQDKPLPRLPGSQP